MRSNEVKTQDNANVQKETFSLAELMADSPIQTPTEPRNREIEYLNNLLANEYALFTKTLNYHWNLTGPRFHSLHTFLDEHYRELLKVIDSVAERVRHMGGHPPGTMQEMVKLSTIPENPGIYPESSEMIAQLRSAHETLQIQIGSILNTVEERSMSPATHDFLVTLLKKHEEMSWMLRSHLE